VLDVSYVGTSGAAPAAAAATSTRRPMARRSRRPIRDPTLAASATPGSRRRCRSISCVLSKDLGISRTSNRLVSSNYHSSQTSLNRRYSKGLLVGIN
jgi:hypothetical protein